MHVSEMMRANLVTTGPDTTFEKLLRTLARAPSRQIYVVDNGGRMLGLVSTYDLLKVMSPFYMDSNLAKALPDDVSFLQRAFKANAGRTASDIMSRDVATLDPSDHFVEAETLFRERGVYVLPVVDAEGRLLGEVTRKVIIKYLAKTLLGDDHQPGPGAPDRSEAPDGPGVPDGPGKEV